MVGAEPLIRRNDPPTEHREDGDSPKYHTRLKVMSNIESNIDYVLTKLNVLEATGNTNGESMTWKRVPDYFVRLVDVQGDLLPAPAR